MLTPEQKAAWQRYRDQRPAFVEAAHAVGEAFANIARETGIECAVISRAKGVASFAKKIIDHNYADPWAQTTDKVGARLIVGSLSDRARLLEAIREAGSPAIAGHVVDKADQIGPKSLGYAGVHFQVVVPPPHTDVNGDSIECEVQLRTRAQDLWAVAEHPLTYKGVVPATDRIKRRIYRLLTLVELFDEELEAAMSELRTLPNYASAELLRAAQTVFLGFTAEPGHDAMSFAVLKWLAPIIEDVPGYATTLELFAASHNDKIAHLIATYGTEIDERYLILTQPESIVLLELIERAPMRLASELENSDLETLVIPLYALWGVSWPRTS
jgi:putative GTP pyrophosphokinase